MSLYRNRTIKKTTSTGDSFDFSLVGVEDMPFKGYNSASDKTRLDPGYMIRGSKNVYKKVSGNIASRPGILRRGASDDTDAGVKSSTEWGTSFGANRYLRVCNGKLEVESDILETDTFVWYELFKTGAPSTSLAADLDRFVFDTVWFDDEASDRSIFVRGDDNLFHWSGGMALVASATADTITIAGDDTVAEQGFATATSAHMKLMIGATEYTYTGVSDNTFTGITPSAVALTANSVIIQSVMAETSTPVTNFKADYVKTINNQVWAGSYSSRVVYISADTDFTDFSNSGAYVYGDPDKVTMDAPGRGIGVKDGKVILFDNDAGLYVITPNENVTYTYTGTDNLARFMYQKIEKKRLAGLTGALGHEFIGNFGDYLVWVDQKNQLRGLSAFGNSAVLKPVHLSIQVQEELSEDDFTDGHLRVILDTIHITAPNTGRDWMYQVREFVTNGAVNTEHLWQPPQVRGISRIALIDGVRFGHSNVYPQIYQLEDTAQWYDDHPSDEQIPYSCVARFAYRQHGRRQGLLTFDKVYFEGYSYPGVELNANIFYDYKGTTSTGLFAADMLSINKEDDQATFWGGSRPVSIGNFPHGDTPLGDGILEEADDQDLLPKFRAAPSVKKQRQCFEYAIEVASEDGDARWELIALGPNVRVSSLRPTYIRK